MKANDKFWMFVTVFSGSVNSFAAGIRTSQLIFLAAVGEPTHEAFWWLVVHAAMVAIAFLTLKTITTEQPQQQ